MQLPPPKKFLTMAMRGFLYLTVFFFVAAIINWFQAPKTNAMLPVTALEVTALDGEKTSLQIGNGKKTIVYFFAPWCGICKASMDALNMFARSENMQTFAVGLDYTDRAELKPFQEKQRATVYAGSPEVQRRFNIDRYPTVYIIDSTGKIAHVMVGYTSRFGIWIRTLI